MQRIITTTLFLLCATSLFAQGYRGRDFWVCFPENALVEGNRALHLSLFIAAEEHANGLIVNGMDSSRLNFSIEAGASSEIDIDTQIEFHSSELVESKSLHVTSDHDITLYVVSHRPASTDSYAAIPTNLLGTSYTTAGYLTLEYDTGSFNSQSAVVATENNTLVTVHLAGVTRSGLPKGRTIEIPLNRGEAFQVQGAFKHLDNDLTGTSFHSDKPIAFFTGHRCAQVPPDVSFCDMLLEMEPPEEDWGQEFILTKFEGKNSYVARIIAGSDSTEVSLNGKPAAMLAQGSYYEIDTLHDNAIISTSKPALIAQYGTSSNADRVKVGDPFMLFVIPNDRFIREVTTTSVTYGEFRHYLNIVLPMAKLYSLRIDGMNAGDRNIFSWMKPLHEYMPPDSKNTVLTFEVPEGRHLIQCGAPMAVYSYGFGERGSNYDSYGHACGMRLGK